MITPIGTIRRTVKTRAMARRLAAAGRPVLLSLSLTYPDQKAGSQGLRFRSLRTRKGQDRSRLTLPAKKLISLTCWQMRKRDWLPSMRSSQNRGGAAADGYPMGGGAETPLLAHRLRPCPKLLEPQSQQPWDRAQTRQLANVPAVMPGAKGSSRRWRP